MADLYGYVNLNLITAQYAELEIGIEISPSPDFITSDVYEIDNQSISGNRIEVSIGRKHGWLDAETTYYYRTSVAVYENKSSSSPIITYTGKTQKFTTNGFSNVATIDQPKNVTMSSAEFDVKIDSTKIPKYKGKYEDCEVLVYYSTDNKDFNSVSVRDYDYSTGKSTKKTTAKINNLKPNQTYYFCVGTKLNDTAKKGEIKTFKTGTFQPSYLTTGTATAGASFATINCSSTILSSVLAYGISISTKKSDVQNENTATFICTYDNENGNYSVKASNLIANTTYYYCAFIKLADNYYYGDIKSFTTLNPANYVKTEETKDVTFDCATIYGSSTVMDVYELYYYDCFFLYSTSKSSLESLNCNKTSTKHSYSNTRFNEKLTNLSPATTYYYCACIVINGNYYYGEIKSFTTDTKATDAEIKLDVLTISDGIAVDYQFNNSAYSFRIGILENLNSDEEIINYLEGSKKIESVSEFKDNSYYTSWSDLSPNTKYTVCILAYDSNGTRGKLNKYSVTTPSENNQPIAELGDWKYNNENMSWGIGVQRSSNCMSYYYLCFSDYKLSTIEAAFYIKYNWVNNNDDSHLINKSTLSFSINSSTEPIVVATWGVSNSGILGGVVKVKGNSYYNAKYSAKKRVASRNAKPVMKNVSVKELEKKIRLIKK